VSKTIAEKTIHDFGEQHKAYSESGGYYVSVDLLQDVPGPLIKTSEFSGRSVVDLGSGTGRWVRVLHEVGAKSIAAIEPSEAIIVCKQKTADLDRVAYHQVTGDQIPDGDYDIVYSFGVVHHIPEPDPVMKRVFQVLRPGGQAVIWLYGRENNGLYLGLVQTLRAITVRVSHDTLDKISALMVPMVRFYSRLAKIVPLPLRGYMTSVIDKLDDYTVKHVIYDQLNPHYAKYYRRHEAISLLERAGFINVRAYHREGYSWTVMGEKPMDAK
jgi:2-polyprenyl-3-methyl-5-hydroxy-6-metoxy-1,4-benzoquinol methylase